MGWNFSGRSAYNKYFKEFEKMIVQEYVQGLGLIYDLVVKYEIPEHNIILNWINKYNSHKEFKVYMSDTLKVGKEKKI